MNYGNLINNSVVYSITNTINNYIYIGSAKACRRRMYGHFGLLKRGKHWIRKLQADWDRQKPDDFKITVLEIVTDLSKIREREQFYLDKFRDKKDFIYNYAKTVMGTGVSLDAEIKEKMRKTHRNPYLIPSNNSTGFKGVCFHSRCGFLAKTKRFDKQYHIGWFKTPEEAFQAYKNIVSKDDEEFFLWAEQVKKIRKEQIWNKGENHPRSKLSSEQRKEIVRRYNKGETQKKLGLEFGLDQSQISRIVRQKGGFIV